ncbi:hypothetical protein [Methanosarcina mazei]|uniref:Uncharacterized protein n=1 Tax=Methanosarcina mazei TaxID=2209 RepID=A0A0F8LMT1_METMZ|nr:hypothetical protein [Methanosarcina mazei]KKG94565.1 hypothetical protein DU69_13865 [Methanosarcina mazei]
MINLDKIKSKNIAKVSILLVTIIGILLLLTVLGTFLLLVVLYLIPGMFEKDILKLYNYDTTLANIHISIANNLLMTFITFLYVLLTVALVMQSKEQVAQSKLEVAQSRKEQQIRDIENRLEKFYIPAEEIINHKHGKREQTVNGYKRSTDSQFVQGLQDLRKYSYLASKTTYEVYERYMSTECTTQKPITCQDIYKKSNFNECENYTYGCHHNWSTCIHNLEYCEYHPDHGESDNKSKDKNKCIEDNANCKYIIDLKKEIVRDIENYKNELLKLKS